MIGVIGRNDAGEKHPPEDSFSDHRAHSRLRRNSRQSRVATEDGRGLSSGVGQSEGKFDEIVSSPRDLPPDKSVQDESVKDAPSERCAASWV